jgi:hypothetical protein
MREASGDIVVEIRINAKVAAALHRWCIKKGMFGVSVSGAVRIAAETLGDMLPAAEKFEYYGEAVSYLMQYMKNINRRRKSGLSDTLKNALRAEGLDETLQPVGPGAHVLGVSKQPAEMTKEEMMAAGKAFMERERLKRVIEGKEPLQTTSDESTPISAEEFAQMEADKREKTRLAFMASLKGGTASDATTDG